MTKKYGKGQTQAKHLKKGRAMPRRSEQGIEAPQQVQFDDYHGKRPRVVRVGMPEGVYIPKDPERAEHLLEALWLVNVDRGYREEAGQPVLRDCWPVIKEVNPQEFDADWEGHE
jgi:hypothetical protein